jgi:hypothetical protein
MCTASKSETLSLRPFDRAYYQTGGVHTAFTFQKDMGTWFRR